MTVQATRTTRTQSERTAAMRKRLLDATVASLYEKGYGGTTTLEVQQRAGVSRGALLHHFAARSELMVAAVEHLTHQRMTEALTLVQEPPPAAKRIEWAVGVLWDTFNGPLYTAALELWLASRNDPDLLAVLKPQERVLGQMIRSMAADLFGTKVSQHPAFPKALGLLLDAQRGAAARAILRSTDNDDRLLESWIDLMKQMTSTR